MAVGLGAVVAACPVLATRFWEGRMQSWSIILEMYRAEPVAGVAGKAAGDPGGHGAPVS